MQLVVAGKLNKQIADQLNISIKTVEAHRAKVMEKAGAHSLAELVLASRDSENTEALIYSASGMARRRESETYLLEGELSTARRSNARVANKSVLPYLCLLPLLALLLGLQAAQAAVFAGWHCAIAARTAAVLSARFTTTTEPAAGDVCRAIRALPARYPANRQFRLSARGSVWLRVEIENRSAQREWADRRQLSANRFFRLLSA